MLWVPWAFHKKRKETSGFDFFLDCHFLDEITPITSKEGIPPGYDLKALGLLFGHEKSEPSQAREDPTMIQAVLQSQDFDPTELIMSGEGLLRWWRKTVKVMTPSGENMTVTTREGPMFEESESES